MDGIQAILKKAEKAAGLYFSIYPVLQRSMVSFVVMDRIRRITMLIMVVLVQVDQYVYPL